jgi:Ca2+-binding EF-hand superfamily protein
MIAKKRLDVARRLFLKFDEDKSGYLTEEEIPYILQETYREMGQNFNPSREDVQSYMRMVDSDKDGKITLQ